MIIHKLLLLESEAQEAMKTLEKEQVYLAKKSEKELSQRIQQLEWEKEATIQKLSQNADKETAEVITKIQAEYKQKESRLIAIFAANRITWRSDIVNDILYKGL